MEEVTYHAVVGATVVEVAIRVFWVAAGSLLTMIGFWGLRRRVRALEGRQPASPTAQNVSPTFTNVVNIGDQGEKFDAEAVARELEKIYTRKEAERIVNLYLPGGREYEALPRREGSGQRHDDQD